jgi:hypothetical protein
MKINVDHCSIFAKKIKKKQSESRDLVIDGIGQEMVSFYGSAALSLLHAEYADQYVCC